MSGDRRFEVDADERLFNVDDELIKLSNFI